MAPLWFSAAQITGLVDYPAAIQALRARWSVKSTRRPGPDVVRWTPSTAIYR